MSLAFAAAITADRIGRSLEPIKALFTSGELGGYWCPRRAAFEDWTLATASANGAPVGCLPNLVLGDPILGDNLALSLDQWTAGTGWSVADGIATKTAGTASVLSLAVTLVPGAVYAIHWTQTRSAGTLTPRFTGGTAVTGTATNSSAGFTQYLIANSGSTTIEFSADAAFAGTVSLVQLRRVQNSPALIFATANKPTLRITPQTRRAWLDSALGLMSAPFAASLGSSCAIARLDPELGVVWSENQTIGTSLNITAAARYNGPVFCINRAVTSAEKLLVERLMLRERPTLGANLATNGDFSSAEGWTVPAGAQIENGILTLATSGTIDVIQLVSLNAAQYWYGYTTKSYVSGTMTVRPLPVSGAAIPFNTPGRYGFTIVRTTVAGVNCGVRVVGATTGTADDYAIREIL